MKRNVYKSVLTLASGTILAQGISFIASPIMTRLYSVESIGEYTLILTVIGMFGSIINARYDMSIVTEGDINLVYPLIKLSLIISFFGSILVSILYTMYIRYTGFIYNEFILFFLVFSLLFIVGISNILISYNNRMKEYKLMSKVSIIQSFSKELSMVLFGYVKFTAFGLIISQFLGQLMGLRKQSESLTPHIRNIKNTTKEEVLIVAKKYSNQPKYSMPALFANSFSYSSINLFIEYLFGTSVLGFYSISYRVLGIPLTLISNNVSKVYYKEASQEYNETQNYKTLFISTSKILIATSSIMVITLIFIAPKLFGLFFGEEWKVAGEYVQILAPMFGVRLIVSPLTSGVLINNKQHLELYVQVLFIIVSTIIFFFTLIFGLQVKVYILLISISFSMVYLIYYYVLYLISCNKL